LAALEESTGLNPKKKGFYGGITDGRVSPPSSRAGVKNSDDMDDEDQASARAIARGVQAWKTLSHRKIPKTQEPTRYSTDRRWVPPPDSEAKHELEEKDTSTHPTVSTNPSKALKETYGCPFSSSSNTFPSNHPSIQLPDPAPQRPDSLPTPPSLYEDPTMPLPTIPAASSSPPPSATGSASKCPIRFLDHNSPEEVAEYFENHKHEIPRSHEVCVKRYQSNAESIRQLDAKYGNLVSMIQGLGMKHQSLLPATEEPEKKQDEQASQKKIERWATDVREVPASQAVAGMGAFAEGDARADIVEKEEEDEREGRFARPLKEIRVGESPSRPWGISMPLAVDVHPDFLHGAVGDRGQDVGEQRDESKDTNSMAPLPDIKPIKVSQTGQSDGRSMVFTGPVLIGYSAEQSAALLQRLSKGTKSPEG